MSELVKQIIKDTGLSQKDAAAELGISAAYLCDVLNGRRQISIDLALRLEKAFDADAEGLLYGQLVDQMRAHRKKGKWQREVTK